MNAPEANAGGASGTGPVCAGGPVEGFERFGTLWPEVLPGLVTGLG